MDTTSVSLVLQKLETATAMARSIKTAGLAAGVPDTKLAELMSTLGAIEQEIREMQQMLNEANGQITDLNLLGKVAHRSESPYYWEDD